MDRVAVGTMVTRVLRSGDLRIEFSNARRARDGIRIHRRIQKSRPDNYEAEVPVSFTVKTAKAALEVSGRIDGVYINPGYCTIEEIKTTVQDLDRICADPDPVHLGQARCYAYMYAVEKKLELVEVQLTYCQVESGDMKSFSRAYSVVELRAFFNDLAGRYLEQSRRLLKWHTRRDSSIDALDFPFSGFRGGQREMAVEVYRTIRDNRQLMVQAATGIGKTLGTLFPAVKAMATIENSKIFYLTARTTGRLAARKAFKVMRESGLRIKTLNITAKDKICFLPERSCNPEDCEFARGYFDRINRAIESIFTLDDFSRSRVEETAREFRVCPFEFSLELVFWVDCVICDYNYAFDPRVSLKQFFIESGEKCIYLIDEAHNLVDRSRAMFSSQIEKHDVLDLRRKIKKCLPAVFRILGKINSWMVKERKQCEQLADGAYSQKEIPAELVTLLTAFVRQTETWLVENVKASFREELLDFYFKAANFLKTAEQYGKEYVTFVEQFSKNLRIKLFCLDPARRLKEAMDNSTADIFFSATMTPATYFRRLLGCRKDTACLQIGSPFPTDHLGLFVADRISTLYRQRSETLEPLCETLLSMVSKKNGNYLLFFPSYKYMTMVHEIIAKTQPALNIIVQKPEMTNAEKSSFLKQFQEKTGGVLVGFAVLGGIFGEGIDLEGDKLSGAAVVGVGLPGISYENELIKAYFNEVEGTGFQYAYQYPGINRVLQAGGRVIRTAKDRGIVLLVDQRYARYSYRSMLPKHWQPFRVRTTRDLEVALDNFWQSRPENTWSGN
jgi:DNA excision repair protein ERCC-2